MTINRYAKRIDANQTAIISALRAAGALVRVIGLPVDLLVAADGRFALFEVKDGDKVPSAQKLTKDQEDFFEEFCDCPLFKVNSPECAVAVLKVWRAGK